MKNFNDKLSQIIRRLDSIDKPDYPMTDINNFADFIELLALFSGTNGISYGDIQDRFFGEPDEQDIFFEEFDENDISENNDQKESFIDRIFLLINERTIQYRENYPFEIDSNYVITLKSNLSYHQKIYVFLLFASLLDISHPIQQELTTDFENLCYETMKVYLPNAIVKGFGKNSEYTGTAKEKIKKLSEDIGIPINDYEFQQIGNKNTQDRGLDIISWIPFEDDCPNVLIFLCQCACGKNYRMKQHDTRRFENYYNFYKTKPQHTLFIPYSLINNRDKGFYNSDDIEKEYLVFERMRILNLNKNNRNVFNKLKIKKIIEKCISVNDCIV